MGMSQSYGPSPGDRQEIIARGILAGRRGPGRRPAVCRHPGREGVTVRDSQPSARRLSGKCTERNRCPARGPRPGRPWAEGPVVLRPSAGVDLGAAAGGDRGEGAGVCASREGEEGPDPRRAGGVDRPASGLGAGGATGRGEAEAGHGAEAAGVAVWPAGNAALVTCWAVRMRRRASSWR